MSGAGDLDRRITLQRFDGTAVNDINEPIAAWFDLATVWASREDLSDREQFAAGQVNAALMSRFKVRSSVTTRGLTPSDQILYDGDVWNISGVKETPDGRKRYLWISATRQAD